MLAQLARGYCACTGWFSSVPGPTWPNRYYVHAAMAPAPRRAAPPAQP
ncbi:MAG TPA: alkaline phosphatase family protein [Chloroflexota bacterium]